MNSTYRTIAGRIRTELQELAQVVERTIHIRYFENCWPLPISWKNWRTRLDTRDVHVQAEVEPLSLPHDPGLLEQLAQYECDSDGNGFSSDVVGERMVLYFGMQLDYSAVYDTFGEDAFRGLANMFEQVQDELLAGNLSAAWAMYKTYGGGEETEPEPVEPLSGSAQTLLDVMENY